MQTCGMHWQCCFGNAVLAPPSIVRQHQLTGMSCAGTAALGASLWLPERAQADIDYKETIIGVNGLSTFQRAAQKAELAVSIIPARHCAIGAFLAFIAADSLAPNFQTELLSQVSAGQSNTGAEEGPEGR